MKTHKADVLTFYKERYVSEKELANLRSEYSVDEERRCEVWRFTARLLATNRTVISVHERWPADWWQAFKERWFPKFLLLKYPVEYKTIDIEEEIYQRVCPHITIPDRSMHLEFLAGEYLDPLRVEPNPGSQEDSRPTPNDL